jgi:hypothetical protein
VAHWRHSAARCINERHDRPVFQLPAMCTKSSISLVAEKHGLEGVVSKHRPDTAGGGRSRRLVGARRIGNGGDCLNPITDCMAGKHCSGVRRFQVSILSSLPVAPWPPGGELLTASGVLSHVSNEARIR